MKTVDREKLWESYQKNPVSEIREQIIIEYAPLVKLVAGRLSMYLGYNVEYEDLVSYGIFGLIDAIDKFDRSKDVKFETYASLRIRGAILDQIRKMDWIPRAVRQKQKKIDEAIKNIEMKTGKTALDEEIASELGVSEDEYLNWQSQLKVTNVVSLNEFVEQGTEPAMDATKNSHFAQPEDVVAESELKEVLAQSLETLTEKERRVIELYYYEELTLKEISSILEVSESRISQLHTRALAKMKKKMGSYMDFSLIQFFFILKLLSIGSKNRPNLFNGLIQLKQFFLHFHITFFLFRIHTNFNTCSCSKAGTNGLGFYQTARPDNTTCYESVLTTYANLCCC